MNDGDLAPIIGASAAMQRAIAVMERFAPTTLSILLVGATGTGKELFARHIHARSKRRGDFIDVDCGALPHDMVEGLLFGNRRGAFTGATDDRAGLIELAHSGTLFLDEILSLPEPGQRKLLRVLDTREVRRLGDAKNRAVDVRLVAAAQDDVLDRLRGGALRRDLYERIAGVVIQLPTLRERPDDLLLLAHHFARQQGQVFESDAESTLTAYDWPGNVRELRKVIQRAGPLVPNGTLPAAAIREAIDLGQPSDAGDRRNRRVIPPAPTEQELIDLGNSTGWDVLAMARATRCGRTTFFKRLKVWGFSLRSLIERSRSSVNVH